MEHLFGALQELGFENEQLLKNEPMARHTTMRVGGAADLVALPSNNQQLCGALRVARQFGVPALVMGAGSNLIVRDGGVRGLIVLLDDHFGRIHLEGETTLIAQAGARLSQLGMAALNAGLTGLEFAAAIPGTVGGGVAMNAGAYGGELKDCLLWADLLIEDEVLRVPACDMAMGYRTSRILKQGGIVLQAAFALSHQDKRLISETMQELARRRREKQPLNYPSSGSTFKRPQGHFAGALIENAGLKGFCVGGAQVSEKHAGFVVNKGGATAQDILSLIKEVQGRVLSHSGVALECEVRVVGEG